MPLPPLRSRVAVPAFLASITLAMTAAPPAKAQISFYTAVDLALRNSHEVKMATADVDRAGLAQYFLQWGSDEGAVGLLGDDEFAG